MAARNYPEHPVYFFINIWLLAIDFDIDIKRYKFQVENAVFNFIFLAWLFFRFLFSVSHSDERTLNLEVVFAYKMFLCNMSHLPMWTHPLRGSNRWQNHQCTSVTHAMVLSAACSEVHSLKFKTKLTSTNEKPLHLFIFILVHPLDVTNLSPFYTDFHPCSQN